MASTSRAATGVRTASPYTESSALEVLQAEVCRNFETEACERIGQDVGFRFVTRFPVGPAPFSAPLDVLKFLCKEVWIELYGKKVDRLQTNHKGTFMCTDTSFSPLFRLRKANQTDLNRFLAIHKGIIRGALVNLGIHVVDVNAQVLPGQDEAVPLGCCFTIKTIPS